MWRWRSLAYGSLVPRLSPSFSQTYTHGRDVHKRFKCKGEITCVALLAVVTMNIIMISMHLAVVRLEQAECVIFIVNHGRKGHARDRAWLGSLSPCVSIFNVHLSRACKFEKGRESLGTRYMQAYGPLAALIQQFMDYCRLGSLQMFCGV